jgi:hypothetical protein
VPAWPSTAGAGNQGSSVTGNSDSGTPSASAAGTQPEPITRTTSWLSAPVSSRSRTAAESAERYGSSAVFDTDSFTR